MRRRLLLAALVALAIPGCGGEEPSASGAADVALLPAEIATLDGLFATNCAGCHREGGPAPFALLDARDRRRRARQIAEVVGSRYMPPWLPDRDLEPLVGARGLDEDEIALVERWARTGAPGADLAPPAGEGDLGPPDLVLEAAGPIAIPAEGAGIQHTLVYRPDLAAPRDLRALAYRPGNPGALHGGGLLLDASGGARRLDERSPEAGYRSPGGMGYSLVGSLDAFSPGARPQPWPDDATPRLAPGETISLELHLNPRGRLEEERGALRVWFAPPGPRDEVVPLAIGSLCIDIPPGARDYRVEDEIELDRDVRLVGLFPMARYVCQEVTLRVTPPGGTPRTVFRIRDFDLNWVQRYQFAAPIVLPAGSRIAMEMVYDNSRANPQNPRAAPERVRAGMRAIDEAGFVILHLAAATADDAAALRRRHEDGFRLRLERRRAWEAQRPR
ncbi:MAG: cytochrome c [Planctomycetota bacterium]